MRYLAIFLALLAGCSDEHPFRTAPIVKISTLPAFEEACAKLAGCIRGTHRILLFKEQRNAPFACAIKTDIDSYYFYPDLDPDLKEVTFGRFELAIAACEMATRTGSHSFVEIKREKERDLEDLKTIEAEKEARRHQKIGSVEVDEE